MSAASDAAARRAEWLKAGAPDYSNPTTNSSGQVTGYVSVASEPESARSQSNQSLDIINGNVVDTLTGQTYPTVQPKPTTSASTTVTTTPSTQATGSDAIALDGQSFKGQTAAVQAEFTSAYGSNAAAVWAQQHDAAILSNASNQGQSTPANVTTNVSTTSPGSGTSTTGSSTATTAATTATVGLRQALDPLWTWAQANPVIAGVLTIGLAGMLFGGKHRW